MYLGIDFGATKILLGLLDDSGQIVGSRKFATPSDYPTFLQDLEQECRELGGSFIMAAIGAPGVIDRANGIVVSYGHRDWHNTPLKADLEKILACPVLLENDGKLTGLAEAMSVINEFKNVLCLAIGTGIGIAYTRNGVIDLSISDLGGHGLLMEHDGVVQPWENFAAGSAIVKQYGKKAADITDRETWMAITHNFSVGILKLLETLTPDVIIIGGGVGAHFDRFSDLLEDELEQALGSRPVPPLRPAQHPEQSVIYGCYEYIKQTRK